VAVTFRHIPYDTLPNGSGCPICLEEFKQEEIQVGHEGVASHAVHESCFKAAILTQHRNDAALAKCCICRKNILNCKDYLPPPSCLKKTVQAIREFTNQHRTISGLALGAISVFATTYLSEIADMGDCDNSIFNTLSSINRLKYMLPISGSFLFGVGFPAVTLSYLENSTKPFLIGMGMALATKEINPSFGLSLWALSTGVIMELSSGNSESFSVDQVY